MPEDEIYISQPLDERIDELEEKHSELEKKLEDVEAMTKHSHPSFKERLGKLEKTIGCAEDPDFIQQAKEISELKEWKEKQEILDKAMRINIHNNIPKLIKSVKKEIGMDILEEVLWKHLTSHIVVAREQLTDKDKLTIFREFDEAIQKQLDKLDKKEYIGSLNDPQCFEATNLGVLKRERKKDGEIKSSPYPSPYSWEQRDLLNKLGEKEPTEDKSIKVDLGIPESVICSKCGKMIAVMEYMARKNNYKNQMCLKCTKDKELSKKGCFNCKYFIDYDLCNERDMESYEEFMYSTFLTAICNNWKEKEPTEEPPSCLICRKTNLQDYYCDDCVDKIAIEYRKTYLSHRNLIPVPKADLEEQLANMDWMLNEIYTTHYGNELYQQLLKEYIQFKKKYLGKKEF